MFHIRNIVFFDSLSYLNGELKNIDKIFKISFYSVIEQ